MSEDNDNDWGMQKKKYYQMNKREDNSEENDSDFIEDEKEAIRLQKMRLEKIKKTKILEEEDEESEKIDKKNDKEKINNDISFKTIDIDNNKILENINTLINCLEEYQNTNDEINILNEEKKMKLQKTMEYLEGYKKLNILYSANILFNIISTLNKKMTAHHPSNKNSAIFNFLLTKNSDKNEEIQKKIEKILISLQKNQKTENEIEDEEQEMEGEEEDEDELEEEDEMEQEEMEEEEDEKLKKIEEKEEISKNSVKKPSFLNKKKKRDDKDNKEIDLKDNENFDNFNEGMEENEEDEDSFIKEQYKNFSKIQKEKENLDKKNKENEKKEIEMKTNSAIRKANEQVLKAKGITRKRIRFQGNAKLMNRLKYYKKEKKRKQLVKEYEGKPDVYLGEATGIRRDLIRSTKLH